jgi:uncharacterized ion transporter superfamily protein YfcC
MLKRFKMPSSYTTLLILMLLVAVFTWIVPAGQYEVDATGNVIAGTYHAVASHPQGLWNMMLAPVYGMLGKDGTGGAIDVALFILIIGGFLGIVNKTGAIDAGIASLVHTYRGRERNLIPLLMIIFAIGGTSFGMAEETMAFYPIIIPVMLLAGFDTMTAVSVVLLGAGMGVLGSTVNPFATGVALQVANIGVAEGMSWRLLGLGLSLAWAIWYVLRYSKKVQHSPAQSLTYDTAVQDHEHFVLQPNHQGMTARQKWVLVFFIMTFVKMIVALVPWSQINAQWTWFETMNTVLTQWPVLGAFLGQDMLPLGQWYFHEITALFLVASLLIGWVYGLSEQQMIEGFLFGAKDLLGVAFIVGLARGVQVVMNDGAMTATLLHWGEQGLRSVPPALFGGLVFVFYVLMSFLIPSSSGLASASMAIMAPLATLVGVKSHVVVTAFQSASGLVNIVTPTSAVVMGALAIARIPYAKWLRFVGGLWVGLFVVHAVLAGLAAVVS